MTKQTPGSLLYSFFEDYLKVQKGLRPASIKSYRDGLRLFVQFVSSDTHRRISKLSISDFTSDRVLRFLRYLEEKRANSRETRNHRLAALRLFFDYIATRVPELLVEAERVQNIPRKRTSPPPTYFLERSDVQKLFEMLPLKGKLALRDRTLLLFLYNTGARVQEVADLRRKDLYLTNPSRVHLHGKGDKWRTCPLWEQTASLLKMLIEHRPAETTDSPVFFSINGLALTRFGIYKIVRRYTERLKLKNFRATSKWVSPHVFRHTTAVHLLESGVDVNVIRGWLGHVSLETTNRYAEINIRMKEKAMLTCDSPLSADYPRKAVWADDESLLNWLDSL
jgi:site-specific recombinase XerD